MFPSVLEGYYTAQKIADGNMVSIENEEYVWTKAHKIVGKITSEEMLGT